MHKRTLRLPALSNRVFLAVCLVVVLASLGFGLCARLSWTDYSKDAESLDSLSYAVSGGLRADELTLWNTDEVISAMASSGSAEPSSDLADAATMIGMAPRDLKSCAPIVLRGVFTGSRTYVYQAFQSKVKVTAVIKGDSIAPGDEICVYETYKIVSKPGSDGGQFGSFREVCPSDVDVSFFALAPMREGQEYLFFLRAKEYPAQKIPSSFEQTYCLIAHPYARISLDITSNSARVDIRESSGANLVTPITFGEASERDLFVADEGARDLYLKNCASILDESS